jgi:hypothetical protein
VDRRRLNLLSLVQTGQTSPTVPARVDRRRNPDAGCPNHDEVNHSRGEIPCFTGDNMEKFCENHPEVAAIIIAPVLYILLWLAMALF